MTNKPVGWRNEPARHALAAKGIETTRNPHSSATARAVGASPGKRISAGGHNWSVECDPDGRNAKLRMDDMMGWRWSGNETSWDIFLVRMSRSRISDEFVNAMRDAGLNYADIKKIITSDRYDLDSSIYSMTGDNIFWHFGETNDQESEIIGDYAETVLELKGDDKKAFEDYFWRHGMPRSTDFESYKRETSKSSDDGSYGSMRAAVAKTFKDADSWEDVISAFSSEDWGYTSIQAQDMWVQHSIGKELNKVGKEFLKERKKTS